MYNYRNYHDVSLRPALFLKLKSEPPIAFFGEKTATPNGPFFPESTQYVVVVWFLCGGFSFASAFLCPCVRSEPALSRTSSSDVYSTGGNGSRHRLFVISDRAAMETVGVGTHVQR